MSTTPHLALPLLAAAQAQKHITHNEAIASLDALVHLAVKERDRDNPPALPAEGDRYLVGTGGVGAFAGHAGAIALFDLGIWRFLAPRPGWRAYIEAEDAIVVFNGSVWRGVIGDTARFERLGIGTQADDQNPLAAKLNTALFTAKGAGEGGTGDLRFVLNKDAAGNVLSQLYQSGYSGRAETGLVGNDDFAIRVSPDGSQWRDAMRIDGTTGTVSFPSGLASAPGANLLINASFLVNQRGHGAGILAAGQYGYDRWKAGPGGCSIGRLADGSVSLTGALDQVVDVAQAPALAGASNFAGRMMTFSVEDPSAPLSVTIGSSTGTIAPGAGRRSVTLPIDAAFTGHLPLRLQSSGTTTFLRPKLELGESATPWMGDWLDVDEIRCRRYYQRVAISGGAPAVMAGLGQRKAANLIDIPYALPVAMRASPTLQTSGFGWTGASPAGNQIGFYDPASAAWLINSGIVSASMAVPASPSALVLRFQAAISFSGSAGAVGQLQLGSTAYLALQAEL